MKSQLLLCIGVGVVLALATPAGAGWIENGVPAYYGRTAVVLVAPDGVGGAFIAWTPSAPGTPVYVTRLDASGNRTWPWDSVAVVASGYGAEYPAMVADGSGGVFVVWADDRGADLDIYAQRLDGDGNRLWGADGVVVNNRATDQTLPALITDGFGNIIVCWEDYTYGSLDIDIYAQRLDYLGNRTWATNGVAVTAAYNNQTRPVMIHDTLFGAIIAWTDGRSATYLDIYAQRIDSNGVTKWTDNGQAVCTAAYHQTSPALVSDGNGGAICAWEDARTNTSIDIYAQRLKMQGGVDWAVNGVVVAASWEDDDEVAPVLAKAPGYDAVIAFTRGVPSGPPRWDVRVNRINGDGLLLWSSDGLEITDTGSAGVAHLAQINEDTYVVAFADSRIDGDDDIYAQAVNLDGAVLWPHNGMPLCTAPNTQSTAYPGGVSFPLVADQTGGAIVAWLDYRAERLFDVYAQRVEPRYGEWGRPEPGITAVDDSPGDQGGFVVVKWSRSDRDRYPQSLISHYSVWRAMEPPEGAPAGAPPEAALPLVSNPWEVGPEFTGTAVWIENRAGMQQYWEWVGNQSAQWQEGYSYTAATRCDWTEGTPCEHFFKVFAHTADPYRFWESGPAGGVSIDNLAPAAPLTLVAERVGNYVRLHWSPGGADEPDFSEYIVYRATSAGVAPEPANFAGTSADTVWWDQNAPTGTPYYYIVAARDVHANESDPSNEANVDATATDAGDIPAPTSLQVLSNMPNPFTGTTGLRIGMPAAGDATIDVYDVSGRRVAVERVTLGPGWQTVPLDARRLPSGVYFYRVRAAGMVVTKKMVVAR